MECHLRALPTPSANDGPRFHTNIAISELIERDTRAVEASVVYSAPPIAKIEDGVTRKLRRPPSDPDKAQGLEPINAGTQVRRPHLVEPIESPVGDFCWKTGRGILR